MADFVTGEAIELRIAAAPTRSVPVSGIQSFVGTSTGFQGSATTTTTKEFGTGVNVRGDDAVSTGISWTMPFEANMRYSGTGSAAIQAALDAWKNGTEVYVWLYPVGVGAGKPKRAGFALVSSYSETNPRDGIQTVSVTFQGLLVPDTANQV
jgi:hypothetical protein